MKTLLVVLLFPPIGLFAQQNGDNTILIHAPYLAHENFTRFKKHLDINEFFYFENTELYIFKTDKRVIYPVNHRAVDWLFYIYCEDSLIIIKPHIASPSWIEWEYNYRKPLDDTYAEKDTPENIAYKNFMLYIEGFGYPITFEKR